MQPICAMLAHCPTQLLKGTAQQLNTLPFLSCMHCELQDILSFFFAGIRNRCTQSLNTPSMYRARHVLDPAASLTGLRPTRPVTSNSWGKTPTIGSKKCGVLSSKSSSTSRSARMSRCTACMACTPGNPSYPRQTKQNNRTHDVIIRQTIAHESGTQIHACMWSQLAGKIGTSIPHRVILARSTARNALHASS